MGRVGNWCNSLQKSVVSVLLRSCLIGCISHIGRVGHVACLRVVGSVGRLPCSATKLSARGSRVGRSPEAVGGVCCSPDLAESVVDEDDVDAKFKFTEAARCLKMSCRSPNLAVLSSSNLKFRGTLRRHGGKVQFLASGVCARFLHCCWDR